MFVDQKTQTECAWLQLASYIVSSDFKCLANFLKALILCTYTTKSGKLFQLAHLMVSEKNTFLPSVLMNSLKSLSLFPLMS